MAFYSARGNAQLVTDLSIAFAFHATHQKNRAAFWRQAINNLFKKGQLLVVGQERIRFRFLAEHIVRNRPCITLSVPRLAAKIVKGEIIGDTEQVGAHIVNIADIGVMHNTQIGFLC